MKVKYETPQLFQIVGVVDKFWVECLLDQRRGTVPAANIAPVSLSGLKYGEIICVARSGYLAQNRPQELNLRKGRNLYT